MKAIPTESDRRRVVLSRVKFDTPERCWLWTGHITATGYGALSSGGRWWNTTVAHRLVWLIFKGELPEYLDHRCRTRHCVNPDHLRPISFKENVLIGKGPTAINAAKTHCTRGHEFTPENTMDAGPPGHGRKCRTCHNAYMKWKLRHKRAGEWPPSQKWNGEFT